MSAARKPADRRRAPAGGRRAAELGAIHAGKRALGWDDDTYRNALQQLTGKTSAAELDDAERALVLDRMRELGFERTGRSAGWKTEPGSAAGGALQVRKAREVWTALGATGALRDQSELALHAFVKRQTGVERLEWCGPAELRGLIEALKGWLARVDVKGSPRAEG